MVFGVSKLIYRIPINYKHPFQFLILDLIFVFEDLFGALSMEDLNGNFFYFIAMISS